MLRVRLADTASAFEVVAPVSNGPDLRVGVMIEVFLTKAIGDVACIRMDLFTQMGENMWADTIAPLEFMPMLTSSEKASLFGWDWCSC